MSHANDAEIVSPEGKTHAQRKFHIHCGCVIFGILTAIVVSYIPITDKIFSHFIFGMPIVPSLVQEVFDRVFTL